ncbi:Uncharacterised protein [Vibrio cholerae]|nr:Uncharacterised protein [Vibrio cholerae]CSD10448.1 Uncharacterised protein [Vibrio cholerae]CSI59296.1 Uncharacterised protein [Vibrio cholerae]
MRTLSRKLTAIIPSDSALCAIIPSRVSVAMSFCFCIATKMAAIPKQQTNSARYRLMSSKKPSARPSSEA